MRAVMYIPSPRRVPRRLARPHGCKVVTFNKITQALSSEYTALHKPYTLTTPHIPAWSGRCSAFKPPLAEPGFVRRRGDSWTDGSAEVRVPTIGWGATGQAFALVLAPFRHQS